MPLPKGIVRVYKRDKSGGRQFLGEDQIDHTPRDEKRAHPRRRRLRRGRRAQADGLQGDRLLPQRERLADRPAQPQGREGRGRRDRARVAATGRSCRRARRRRRTTRTPSASACRCRRAAARASSTACGCAGARAPAHARGARARHRRGPARGRAALRVAAASARARARPGAADARCATDTIVLWFSSTKPLMSVAIGQLVERGLVDFDDPVARHVPEFAANGKAGITLRHLLTHTAGIAERAPQLDPRELGRDRRQDLRGSARAGLADRPRLRATTSRRRGTCSARSCAGATAVPYDRYVREAIFAPLGDRRLLGRHDRGGLRRERGADRAAATTSAAASSQPIAYWAWTGSAESLAICRPGGSGWGTARALAGFYAMLLAAARRRADPRRPTPSRRLTAPRAARRARPRALRRRARSRARLRARLEARTARRRRGTATRGSASRLRPRRLLLVGRVRRSRARPRGRARLERRRPSRKSTTRARTRRSTRCTRTSG